MFMRVICLRDAVNKAMDMSNLVGGETLALEQSAIPDGSSPCLSVSEEFLCTDTSHDVVARFPFFASRSFHLRVQHLYLDFCDRCWLFALGVLLFFVLSDPCHACLLDHRPHL